MKYTILIIGLLFGQKIVAQTTFYITPLVNYKLMFSGYGYDQRFGFYSENQPSHLQNPYYSSGVKRISHRPSINIGFRLSASLNESKHLLMFEWSQDEAGNMSKTTEFTTTNTTGTMPSTYPIYSLGTSYFQSSFAFNRFTIQHGFCLSKESFSSKIYLMSDLSLAVGSDNRMEWINENTLSNNSVYYHNQAKLVSTKNIAMYYGGKYLMIGLGLKADISVNIKNTKKYLFSLETNYRQGFKVMAVSENIKLINDNNNLVAFSNGLVSKGSGIYIQLSRKFKFHSIKKKSS